MGPIINTLSIKSRQPNKVLDSDQKNFWSHTKAKTTEGPTTATRTCDAFPWVGVLSVILAICCGVACLVILVISNGQGISQWRIQPAVYLAAFNAAAGASLVYALSEGIAIYWWRAALSRSQVSKTQLDKNWRFGTSFWAALLAGKHTNVVSLATIFVSIVAVNGILIQRATTTKLKTIIKPTYISAMVAQEFPHGYTGYVGGRRRTVGLLTPRFCQVVKDNSQNTPITTGFSGCGGTCYGNISAAGLYPSCTVQAETDYIAATRENLERSQAAFSTNFTMNFRNNTIAPNISLAVSYIAENSGSPCYVKRNIVRCSLLSATLNYPVQITNSTLTLDTSRGPSYDLISLQNHTVFQGYGDNATPNSFTTIGGLQLALQNLYGSNASYLHGGGIGFVLSAIGSMASEYSVINETSFFATQAGCGGIWRDPTRDILHHINDMSFRTAISAYTLYWNGKDNFPVVNTSVVPQNISMMQSSQELVYSSRTSTAKPPSKTRPTPAPTFFPNAVLVVLAAAAAAPPVSVDPYVVLTTLPLPVLCDEKLTTVGEIEAIKLVPVARKAHVVAAPVALAILKKTLSSNTVWFMPGNVPIVETAFMVQFTTLSWQMLMFGRREEVPLEFWLSRLRGMR